MLTNVISRGYFKFLYQQVILQTAARTSTKHKYIETLTGVLTRAVFWILVSTMTDKSEQNLNYLPVAKVALKG